MANFCISPSQIFIPFNAVCILTALIDSILVRKMANFFLIVSESHWIVTSAMFFPTEFNSHNGGRLVYLRVSVQNHLPGTIFLSCEPILLGNQAFSES